VSGTGRVGVGVVGTGNISRDYLALLTRAPDVEVRFIAGRDSERAAARATEYGIGRFGDVDALFARDDIEIVVNLTPPAVHAQIGLRALVAGKHVWSEKPLATDPASAASLVAAGAARGLRVSGAPDTILGPGMQAGLRAIARGEIGEPLTAVATFRSPGPESWHPDPAFLYAPGAGPLFDIGPYHLTALAHVFGPARRVQALSSTDPSTRIVGSGPRAGAVIPVLVPTFHAALLDYGAERSALVAFSFHHARGRSVVVEIDGTEGTLALPDPVRFDGTALLWRPGDAGPTTVEPLGAASGRGVGVIDLARSLRADVPDRTPGVLAAHIVDVLAGIRVSAETGEPTLIGSRFDEVGLLPDGWDPASSTLGG
jgi:predicted dehydrogenase